MIARRNLLLPAFLSSLAAVYCTAFYVAAVLPSEARPQILAAAVTVDLTLLVPLLYYLLLVRGKQFPLITLVPVFLGSLLAASYIIPTPYQNTLNLLEWMIVPVELTVAGVVAYKIYQFKKHVSAVRAEKKDVDVFELIQNATRETLGANVTARILAFELAVIYFALLSWRTKAQTDSVTSFSYHKNTGYGAIVFGFVFLLAVETFVVHFLVQHWWNATTTAWILTALSVYGALWFIGDYQAIKLRPIYVLDDALDFRLGLRWNVRIPFEAIESFGNDLPKAENYLKAAIEDEPNYFIQLKESHQVQSIYGFQKEVKLIGFSVDEPAAFSEILRLRLETWKNK